MLKDFPGFYKLKYQSPNSSKQTHGQAHDDNIQVPGANLCFRVFIAVKINHDYGNSCKEKHVIGVAHL